MFKAEDINPNGPFAIVSPVCLGSIDEATDLHEKLTKVAKASTKEDSPTTLEMSVTIVSLRTS